MPDASNSGVPVSAESVAASHVSEIKQRLKTLQADEAELVDTELLFRVYCKRLKKQVAIDIEQAEADLERWKKLLAPEIEQAEAELEAAVAAPVDGGSGARSGMSSDPKSSETLMSIPTTTTVGPCVRVSIKMSYIVGLMMLSRCGRSGTAPSCGRSQGTLLV
eukprot:m.123371 g.123371  ORF g.123371 m.123371 type:complete len:163 (+) comp13457_c0_seq4:26-514(+)